MNAGNGPSSSSSDAELGTPQSTADCNESGVKNDTSTIVFPSKQGARESSPPLPNPFSPDSSAELGSSFAGRRASALTLHLDLSKPNASNAYAKRADTAPGDRPKTALDPVADSSNDMGEVKEAEARRASHGRVASFVPSSATYCSPPSPFSPPSTHGYMHVQDGYGRRSTPPKIAVVTSSPSPPFSSRMSSSITMPAIPLIRKKSGEIVKSSLKTRSKSVHSRHRPSLSLGDLVSLPLSSPSLSAPASPSELPVDCGSVPSSLHSASVKIVHFASQLEHVKHFRTEQKPAAVSRDGSPTLDDTTSGGESGGEWSDGYFPASGTRRTQRKAPSSDEEATIRKTLAMRVLNMPSAPAPHTSSEVWLEHLRLSEDASCVQGTVSVKNIAFEKQVVVRFTFDGWQTTSEVGARWKESCVPPSPPMLSFSTSTSSFFAPNESTVREPPPTYDRFEFSIKLTDMLLRIDEKTLVLAIRYNSGGREMWDNNDGQNYRAVFEKRSSTIGMSGPAVVHVKPEEQAVDAKALHNALGLSLERRQSSIAREEKNRAIEGDSSITSPTKRPSDSLAMRYDLGTSLKNPASGRPMIDHAQTWNGRGHSAALHHAPEGNLHDVHPPARHHYVPKKPMFTTHTLHFKARPMVTGSPRDSDIEALGDQTARFGFAAVGSNFVPQQNHLGSRRHRRTDYFDPLNSGGGFGYGKVRITPPSSTVQLYGYGSSVPQRSMSDADASSAQSSVVGTPICEGTMSPSRCHSFPPLNGTVNTGMEAMANIPWSNGSISSSSETSSSEASTPSITSVSSPTLTPSPSSPPDFTSIPLFNIASELPESESSSMDPDSYNNFINSFCFYTGPDSVLEVPSDIRRSMSDSSIEGMLSSTPNLTASESFPVIKSSHPNSVSTTPTLSTGFGMHGSGFSTPKAMSNFTSSPSLPTPITG
ncbi:hypothetical protein SCHPADRAFT_132116 [Schizopora paradoxa]|uniref:CBM21 domain-containing protein n=1 Tax=Schizopora paradoxa TaxID=27342 RepID=A0A0H2S914_9AGAM|nr:hypothetical protein SCHPADRAFT_132116 [Schizopora paradoxa]